MEIYPDKQSVTIRLDSDLIKKIDDLRNGTERNRTQQIAFMLKMYINLIEKK